MAEPTKWHARAVCPCGRHWEAPFSSLFHASAICEYCPRCGRRCTDDYRYRGAEEENFRVETMRWKSASVWWKPSTWGTGRWETLGEEVTDG